jgi:hypothetical protein
VGGGAPVEVPGELVDVVVDDVVCPVPVPVNVTVGWAVVDDGGGLAGGRVAGRFVAIKTGGADSGRGV